MRNYTSTINVISKFSGNRSVFSLRNFGLEKGFYFAWKFNHHLFNSSYGDLRVQTYCVAFKHPFPRNIRRRKLHANIQENNRPCALLFLRNSFFFFFSTDYRGSTNNDKPNVKSAILLTELHISCSASSKNNPIEYFYKQKIKTLLLRLRKTKLLHFNTLKSKLFRVKQVV